MTKAEYLTHISTTLNNCINKIQAKDAEYNGDEGPFKTYRATELMGNCSTEQGIMSRIIEKTSRISTQLNTYAPGDESLTETITDTIGCLAILLAYMDSKESQPQVHPYRCGEENQMPGWNE